MCAHTYMHVHVGCVCTRMHVHVGCVHTRMRVHVGCVHTRIRTCRVCARVANVHVGCVHTYTRTWGVCDVCVCLYIDKRLVEWPSYFTSFGLDNLFINSPLPSVWQNILLWMWAAEFELDLSVVSVLQWRCLVHWEQCRSVWNAESYPKGKQVSVWSFWEGKW